MDNHGPLGAAAAVIVNKRGQVKAHNERKYAISLHSSFAKSPACIQALPRTNRNTTACTQAERAPQASEHRWVTTLQSIGDAVISTDPAQFCSVSLKMFLRSAGKISAFAKFAPSKVEEFFTRLSMGLFLAPGEHAQPLGSFL
jgi:hypothetical protein